MQSGDEATKNLRSQLKNLEEEFEAFKRKAKDEYERMETKLTEKAKRDLDEQKEKYERMIAELKRNASSDKEFLQNELRKKIADLEKEIEDLKEAFAKERETLMGG